MNAKPTILYDFLVSGQGHVAKLLALRLCQAHQQAKIAMIGEDSPTHATGRAELISEELHRFFERSLAPLAGQTPALSAHSPLSVAGVFAGAKLLEMSLSDLFSEQCFQKLGGKMCAQRWTHIKELTENLEHKPKQASNKMVKAASLSPKDPFWNVLACMGNLLGIPDPRECTVLCLAQRMAYFRKPLWIGQWGDELSTITEGLGVKVHPASPGLATRLQDNVWQMELAEANIEAKKMFVTQAPWEAITWLRREDCTRDFLKLALKTSPASHVNLVLEYDTELPLPELILVPQENAFALRIAPNFLRLQKLISHETFLSAPQVVKAVKALKRVRSRLAKHFALAGPSSELLSLQPIGWAQDSLFKAHNLIEKLEYSSLNSSNLAFCGDTYGGSYDPDHNTIRSLLAAVACSSEPAK